ncbi:MAG: transglycosylase domain-containing protein [Deltaproteobacteria bacterium]|nr:transglycosylase domain-containing protein [Deltaproteobacteria bacterium]
MTTPTPIKPIRVGERARITVKDPRGPRHVKGTMVIVDNPRSSNIFLGFFKGIVFLLTVVGVMGAFGAGAVYLFFSFNLPQVGEWKPKVDTKIYARDGTLIGDFYDEVDGRREPLPVAKIPTRVIKAFLAAEDAEFFDHEGFNIVSIGRALVENLRAGRTRQGGSTITQQVAKGYFAKERALKRKVRELIVASRMERQFSKEEILSRYLNGVYLGHGASGVEAASQNYFGKGVRDLTLGEAAMLAGLPQAPSEYSPAVNFDAAKQQQKKVLERGVKKGFFTREEADAAMAEKIEIHKERPDVLREVVPYYTEHVRRDLEQRYGKDLLYGGGLRVETAVDVKKQLYAQDAIVAGMINMDKKEGWRGAWMKLARSEWPAFIAKQKNYYGDLSKSGLMPGRVYLGLVTGVGARGKIVKIGDHEVVVAGESARWTGGRYHEGDVIDVELADAPKKKPVRRLKKDEPPPPEDGNLLDRAGVRVRRRDGGRVRF